MWLISLPLIIAFTAITVLLFAAFVRRLLGTRFSLVRTVLAGLIAFLLATPIVNAVGGRAIRVDNGRAPEHAFPGLWFVLLGVGCALLVGMVFLVLAEAIVPSGTLPGPVYIARSLRDRYRRSRRYLQITRTVFRYGLGPYLRGGRRAELTRPEGRRHLAHQLGLALDEGGTTFVKLGQVLSTRRDILPEEFAEELSRLQERATAVPWPEIRAVLIAELGDEPEQIFAEFDQVPIASASIAQVHVARLRSGEAVVVKVRKPGIERTVERDLDIVDRLATTLRRRTSWGTSIGITDLAHGFATALREELDLRIEAGNMAAIAAVARPEVVVPQVYPTLCTARVLVMQRLMGVSLGALPLPGPTPAEREQLAASLLDDVLRQILVDGVFHADPHPGNMLLLDDGRLALLDYGSVGRIDAGLRSGLQRLMLAVDRGTPALVCTALLEIVERPESLDEHRLERALGAVLARYVAPQGVATFSDAQLFTELFRLVAAFGLGVPAEIAAVFRSLGTLEGSLRQLSPGFDVVAGSRRFAAAYFAEQLRPEAVRQAVLDDLVMLLPMLQRLPGRLDRITSALEGGRLAVSVRLLSDGRERRTVAGLLDRALLAFLAATTGIMAVLLLGLDGGPRMTDTVSLYAFFGYCLLVISAVLALRVLVVVFRRDHPGA